jgi:hypothetical protein
MDALRKTHGHTQPLQLVQQEVAFFDVTAVGELSNRLAEDTRAMKDAATTSISMALR